MNEYSIYESSASIAIRCHHNDIYNYIFENLVCYSYEAKIEIGNDIAIECNNYSCFSKDIKNIYFFNKLCENGIASC